MTLAIIPANIVAAARSSHDAVFPLGPFVSVTIAQWIIESASGKSLSGKNNCFGIKATKDQIARGLATLKMTHETINGVYQPLPQWFADFDSLDACFLAHAHLLASSPYYVKAQHAPTPDAYAMALQGIYATGIPDHPYGETLITVMRQNNLYQFDQQPAPAPAAAKPGVEKMPDTAKSTGSATVPTIAQSQPSDWGSFGKQFLDHVKPALESALNAGVDVLEHTIPGGFIIGMFVGPQLVDQWTDNAFDIVEGLIEKDAAAIPKDGLAGFVSNMALSMFAGSDGDVLSFMTDKLGQNVLGQIEEKVQAGIAAGRALIHI